MELLKKQVPEIFSSFSYLRDIVYKETLSEKDILSILKKLPVTISLKELMDMEVTNSLKMQIEDIPERLSLFPVREVFLYGIAECSRSRLASSLLADNRIDEFGRLMNISHNGDRVVVWIDRNTSEDFHNNYSDRVIEKLAERIEKSEIDSELSRQPGSYRCSIPEIDRMVDISLSVNGVIGAQISGAGLGGCMMVMVKEDSYEKLEQELLKKYYDMLNLEPDMFITYPVEGSGPVFF